MTTKKVFRKNVAIVVLNDEGRILAGHRSDITGVWQLPQGGIEKAETEEQAMYRELAEEIGTSAVDILYKLPTPLRYDWPQELHSRGYHGQEQTYFLVRLKKSANADLLQSTPEFDKFEWLSATEFMSRLSGFKKEVYLKAITLLREKFGRLIAE